MNAKNIISTTATPESQYIAENFAFVANRLEWLANLAHLAQKEMHSTEPNTYLASQLLEMAEFIAMETADDCNQLHNEMLQDTPHVQHSTLGGKHE